MEKRLEDLKKEKLVKEKVAKSEKKIADLEDLFSTLKKVKQDRKSKKK